MLAESFLFSTEQADLGLDFLWEILLSCRLEYFEMMGKTIMIAFEK